MLNKGVDQVLFNDGVAWGIQIGDEVKCAEKLKYEIISPVLYREFSLFFQFI